ncbi:flippase-like domain-containing protein [Candidatus Saccharibacteria bacterium]|nr:flippase-like domain-containing protein [Candidatus Saccharibacteria bacterium]
MSEIKPEKPAETRKKKRYKQFLVILFVLANIAIILWTASQEFSSNNKVKFSEVKLHWWLLIPAILSFLVALTAEIHKYNMLLKRFTGKGNKKLARQTVLLGRYYDNITPAAIGGQPFQISHMLKSGVPSEHAAMVPILGFVTTQLAFVLLGILTLIFGANIVLSPVTYAAAYFGLILYASLPVLILFFALTPKTAKKLLSALFKFLNKIHVVKNVRKTEEKVFTEIEKYSKCIKDVVKNKKMLGKTMGLSLVYQLGMTSIPFFVISAFGGGISYLAATMTTISIMAAISFVPTPGNAGAAEGSFYLVFSALSSGYTFWAMITWRFFSYYLFIALGGLTYLELGLDKKKSLDESSSS